MEIVSKKRSAAEITPARNEAGQSQEPEETTNPSKRTKLTAQKPINTSEIVLYLNKLCCYPKTAYSPYMLSFREILFEDYLKGKKLFYLNQSHTHLLIRSYEIKSNARNRYYDYLRI